MITDIPTTSYLDFDLTISDIGSISIFISAYWWSSYELTVKQLQLAVTRFSDAKLTCNSI